MNGKISSMQVDFRFSFILILGSKSGLYNSFTLYKPEIIGPSAYCGLFFINNSDIKYFYSILAVDRLKKFIDQNGYNFRKNNFFNTNILLNITHFLILHSIRQIFNNYAILQGVDKIIPVDMYVPGCPPRPEQLMEGILKLYEKVEKESMAKKKDSKPKLASGK